MIQRIFHPVDQGAFYSERHSFHNINIVYDCGTTNPKSPAKRRVVNQSFRKDEVIHILFISHFDKDHISLIDTLKNTVSRIERVVIPLLYDEEKIFLSNAYKLLGEPHLANLVSNPSEFFGRETQVIAIQPGSEERIIEPHPVDVSEFRETVRKIPNGTPLILNGLNDWVYIPFNHEYQNRYKEFLCKLQEKNIDIDELKNNPNYTLETRVKETIKKIYKEINGNINENSMFLYSGPLRKKDLDMHCRRGRYWWYDIFYWRFPYYPHHCDSYRVACLYTGDGNLNKVNVRTIYQQYWDLIGTIQIPHHGSLASFNANFLGGKHFLCPISVGKNNCYGHPSQKVINEIHLNRSCPILVTEDMDSTFVEIIIEYF